MYLSSIFNFESLTTVRPTLPRTLLVAVVLIVLFESLFRFSPQPWTEDPISLAKRVELVETDLFVKRQLKPTVLILGSSRAAFGINPEILAKSLNLRGNQVANAGYPSLEDIFLKHFFDRNIEHLTEVTLAIIVVDEYYLMTPKEDLEGKKLWFDRIFTFRTKIKFAAYNLKVALGMQKPIELNFPLAESGMRLYPGSQKRFSPLDTAPERFKSNLDGYFKNKQIDLEKVKFYETFAKHLNKLGVTVLFVQIPSHPVFESEKLRLYRSLNHQHLEAMSRIAAESKSHFQVFLPDSGFELNDKTFRDAVHLQPEGANAFSSFFAAWLVDQQLFKKIL